MSNKENLQQNNTRLSENNIDLSSILEIVNNLPEKVDIRLQEKTVTPSNEQQEIVSDEGYIGLNKVTVEPIETEELNVISSLEDQVYEGIYGKVNIEGIETEELNIIPSGEEQINEGLYNKITVAGDTNLISDNIKKGVSIFGIEGNVESTEHIITDCSYLFYKGARIDSINETLSLCKPANCSNMFAENEQLKNIDISNLDTSNVTDMSSMFYNCKWLENLDVSNFNTSNVTSMLSMFNGCLALTNLDVSSFDTSNVTSLGAMFRDCHDLTTVDVSNFVTNKNTSMGYMFYECNKLTSLDLSNFDTSNVTNMQSTFHGCNKLTSLDLSNFNTSNVTSMGSMFYECKSLTNLDLSNFNTSNVTSMRLMFGSCKLTSLNLTGCDMSKVTDIYNIFGGSSSDNTTLTSLKGAFKNLGQGYTQKSANYSSYKLNLSYVYKLEHDDLLEVINNLYDLNLTYDVANGGTLYTQSLQLGSNKSDLSAEEIAIATNKGWTVS